MADREDIIRQNIIRENIRREAARRASAFPDPSTTSAPPKEQFGVSSAPDPNEGKPFPARVVENLVQGGLDVGSAVMNPVDTYKGIKKSVSEASLEDIARTGMRTAAQGAVGSAATASGAGIPLATAAMAGTGALADIIFDTGAAIGEGLTSLYKGEGAEKAFDMFWKHLPGGKGRFDNALREAGADMATLGAGKLVKGLKAPLKTGAEKATKYAQNVSYRGIGIPANKMMKATKKTLEALKEGERVVKYKKIFDDMYETLVEDKFFKKTFKDVSDLKAEAANNITMLYKELKPIIGDVDKVTKNQPSRLAVGTVGAAPLQKGWSSKIRNHELFDSVQKKLGENVKDSYNSLDEAIRAKAELHKNVNYLAIDDAGLSRNSFLKDMAYELNQKVIETAKKNLPGEDFVLFQKKFKQLGHYFELGSIYNDVVPAKVNLTGMEKMGSAIGSGFRPTELLTGGKTFPALRGKTYRGAGNMMSGAGSALGLLPSSPKVTMPATALTGQALASEVPVRAPRDTNTFFELPTEQWPIEILEDKKALDTLTAAQNSTQGVREQALAEVMQTHRLAFEPIDDDNLRGLDIVNGKLIDPYQKVSYADALEQRNSSGEWGDPEKEGFARLTEYLDALNKDGTILELKDREETSQEVKETKPKANTKKKSRKSKEEGKDIPLTSVLANGVRNQAGY